MIIVSDIFDVLVPLSFFERVINRDLIEIYKKTNLDLYLFTSANLNKDSEELQSLIKEFKNVFNTKNLGFSKFDVSAYKLLAEKIGVETEEIIFLDDKDYNVDTAKEAGCVGIQYENNEKILEVFRSLNIL